jgi:hypothetical protein
MTETAKRWNWTNSENWGSEAFPGLLHKMEEEIKLYRSARKARAELSHASEKGWAFVGPPTYHQWMAAVSTAALNY